NPILSTNRLTEGSESDLKGASFLLIVVGELRLPNEFAAIMSCHTHRIIRKVKRGCVMETIVRGLGGCMPARWRGFPIRRAPRLLAVAMLILGALLGALTARANQLIVLQPGFNLVTCQVNGVGGNSVNSTAFLQVPPSLSDPTYPITGTNAEMFAWNCTGYLLFRYFTGPDYDTYFGIGGASDGWYEPLMGGPANVIWHPGRGLIFFHYGAAPATLTLIGADVITPMLPPTNYCGCDYYSLLGVQATNVLGTFENVTGVTPK